MTNEELNKKISQIKEKVKEEKDNYIKNIIKRFEELEPFNDNIERIPSLPVIDKEIYDTYVVPNLIRCGAIPKDKLEVGCMYLGDCRNASKAIWNGEVFIYKRTKFGYTFDEDINHFQDDDGYDVFVPIKKIEE